MTNLPIGLIVELMVCVLLVVTIGYCVVLNQRLSRLRADEANLRATISELITATEIAERAIQGLRSTAVEADQTLGQRLKDAEFFSTEIAREIEEGEAVLERITQITRAASSVSTRQATRQAAAFNPAQDLRERAAAAAERLAAYRKTSGERAA
jgi:hypothetical protein